MKAIGRHCWRLLFRLLFPQLLPTLRHPPQVNQLFMPPTHKEKDHA